MGAPASSNRIGCMLHGALQTVNSIGGAVPVVHSSSGCAVQQYWGGSSLSGCSGSGYTGGIAVPSTNVTERQVVFGATSRLREQLKNAAKIKKGGFFVVLTGCATELVGDDVPAMTKELQEQSEKAIHVSTPGFKGGVHDGYTAVVKGILQQIGQLGGYRKEPQPNTVNLFGIIPEQDVFWEGNLTAVTRALEGIGLQVNVLFGKDSSLEAWQQVFSAGLNISLSAYGVDICHWLERQHGIPYAAFNSYPVGAEQTSAFVRTVGERLGIAGDAVAAWTRQQEQTEAYYIAQILDAYYRHNFQRTFAIVGDSGIISGLAGFLFRPLGLLPAKIIVTDPLNSGQRAAVERELREAVPFDAVEIIFEGDGARIRQLLLSGGIELVLGSSIEEGAARAADLPFVPVSFPISDRVVLAKGFAGYTGAIAFLEELGSGILRHERVRAQAKTETTDAGNRPVFLQA